MCGVWFSRPQDDLKIEVRNLVQSHQELQKRNIRLRKVSCRDLGRVTAGVVSHPLAACCSCECAQEKKELEAKLAERDQQLQVMQQKLSRLSANAGASNQS